MIPAEGQRSDQMLLGALWIQIDQRPPRRLQLEPRVPDTLFQLDPTWQSLEQQHQTLIASFTDQTHPGPVIDAATAEIELPAETRSVRVWQASGPEPLWVAAAYRAPKPYRPSEQSYRAWLDEVDAEQAFALLQQAVTATLTHQPSDLWTGVDPRSQTAAAQRDPDQCLATLAALAPCQCPSIQRQPGNG